MHPNMEIIKYNLEQEEKILLYFPEQQIEERSSGGRRYKINSIAAEILTKFDGTRTYNEIIDYFVEKYSEQSDVVEEKIKILLSQLKEQHYFEIKKQRDPSLHEIKTTTYSNIYPIVASIELTDKCNMRCRHCYGKFSLENHHEMPLEKLNPLLKSLREIGVLTIELTGGDPSVYPYTAEAIDIAFDVGIQSVMLLTNGVRLDSRVVEAVVRHKDRMFVQIDIHSLDEEYFNWFTGSNNTLSKVKNTIIDLTSRGVQVRVCSMITPKNYHEVLNIAEWAYEHGAKLYAPSAIVELGRANDANVNNELLFSTLEELEEFNRIYGIVQERYPNFTSVIASQEQLKRRNCGALTSQCSIKANGEVKLCTMDTGDYFALNIGNALDTPIKTLYNNNVSFLSEFLKLPLPDKTSDECRECIYYPFCDGCLLRGFLRAQDMKKQCNWYQKCVPQIVKDRFPIG
jgi:radical SAM protein with 4Fe4S-binding SPASM domain